MNKIILTADIHWGVLNKEEDTLWALNKIEEYANDNNIKYVFILGDLFHNRLALNITNYHILLDFFKSSSLEWITFPGNHDLPKKDSWTITVLTTLSDYITLITDIKKIKIYNFTFWILPFIKSDKIYMKAVGKINSKASENDILLTHVAVNKATYNYCFMDHHTGIVSFEQTKFRQVFAGHFHNYEQIGNFYYVGSPIPFRYDEGIVDHGFVVLDEDYNTEFIDLYQFDGHPPYYLSVLSSDIDNIDVEGNNIRIIVDNEEFDFNQNEICKKLYDKGALQVKIHSRDIQREVTAEEELKENQDLLSLTESYIQSVDLPDIDKNYLIELNRDIMAEDD